MPRLLTFPSDDIGFRVVVDRLSKDGEEAESIARFERRLRRWSPAAVVRRRQLTSEADETWYVYRDGDAAAKRDEAWTEAPGTASARWSREGRVVWANEAWLADQAEPWEALEGRHYASWLLPEHHAAAQAMLDAVAAGAHVHTVGTTVLQGRNVTAEFCADPEDDGIRTWVRLVVVTSQWQPLIARAQLRLTVRPGGAGRHAAAEAAIRAVLEAPETEAAIRRVVAGRLPGRQLGTIAVEVRSVHAPGVSSALDEVDAS